LQDGLKTDTGQLRDYGQPRPAREEFDLVRLPKTLQRFPEICDSLAGATEKTL
jgi:hypothetical protein